ncbi:MSMEG_1061 family FMN-dependent PPOX-type flavoprotein [Klenkia sp. PcliD-1-E]|uniref:MSMEG_1061 family FMN-dependent PPOX-type flavoprotein n=1 Tax=Klenkia sp. PcliD-1-E TaxID=2954492 RepID=UPI00209695D7|nr:MSMEG_1061 family FMN-dependent PPOX-type flavoprotein [Klenkia sp. PcliD-1-E]MCO7221624.1 pyridoxamine 5'-phosphate oxidase family protein [Klenkia sp. PcliD-1-E]
MDGALDHYRGPNARAVDKVIDHVDHHCAAFIGLSPFAVLSTADAQGSPDVSPRGGVPGFVRVLDEHTLVLPDREGNYRLDSLHNLQVNAQAALMFVVPGIEETLRVYGRCRLVPTDEVDLDLVEYGKRPLSVLLMDVERAYFHCAKAIMRSKLWDPGVQVHRSAFPPMGQVWREHTAADSPAQPDHEMRAELGREL